MREIHILNSFSLGKEQRICEGLSPLTRKKELFSYLMGLIYPYEISSFSIHTRPKDYQPIIIL